MRKSDENEKKFETWVFDQMKIALKNSQTLSLSSSDKNSYLSDLKITY
jgi:hypothetical protein